MMVRYAWCPVQGQTARLSLDMDYQKALRKLRRVLCQKPLEIGPVWWPLDLCPWRLPPLGAGLFQTVYYKQYLTAIILQEFRHD